MKRDNLASVLGALAYCNAVAVLYWIVYYCYVFYILFYTYRTMLRCTMSHHNTFYCFVWYSILCSHCILRTGWDCVVYRVLSYLTVSCCGGLLQIWQSSLSRSNRSERILDSSHLWAVEGWGSKLYSRVQQGIPVTLWLDHWRQSGGNRGLTQGCVCVVSLIRSHIVLSH